MLARVVAWCGCFFGYGAGAEDFHGADEGEIVDYFAVEIVVIDAIFFGHDRSLRGDAVRAGVLADRCLPAELVGPVLFLSVSPVGFVLRFGH